MGGGPSRRNKPLISHFSGVEWTKKTTASKATGKWLNKRLNEQYNVCAGKSVIVLGTFLC